MYLKRIELYGFKSFSGKSKIEFEPGISCIVGPNGSGKSNLADALRWVLGESNARSIRGSRMEDVIFSGTASRRALGLAEVTVVLDNADSYLDLPFSEISVTRRAVRNGASEYYINSQPCRLRDIHDLFVDTGIGVDGVSLIDQGRVNELVSARPEERRVLVEEAAGIVKYRDRKQEAARKLAETERHLERIGDIISELEGRVEPLREQAERAEKYLDLQRQADDLEIGVSVRVLSEAQGKIDELDAQVREKEEAALAAESRRLAVAAEAEQLRLAVAEMGEAVSQANEEYYQMQTQRERQEGQIKLLRSQAANAQEQRGRLNAELQALEQAESQRLEKEAQLASEIEELQAAIRHKEELIASGEGGSQDIREHLEALLREQEQLRLEAAAAATEQAKAQQSLEMQSAQADKIRASLGLLAEEEKQLAAELSDVISHMEQGEERRAELEGESGRLLSAYNESQQQLRLASLAAQERAAEEADCRFRCHSLETRVNLLTEMSGSYEGFFPGVKGLLSAWRRGEAPAGILGVMAELMEVPEQFRVAVEAYLGANIQNIVCRDTLSAKASVAYLKQRQLGRATFLPLDTLRVRRAQDISPVLGRKKVFGRASELIKVEAEVQPALDFLLNNLLLVEDMDAALSAAKALDYRVSAVTLEGDVVNPGASISGGSRGSKAGELLAKKARVEEAKAGLKQAQAELSRAEQALNEAREKSEQAGRQSEELSQRVREISALLQETTSRLEQGHIRRDALDKRQQAIRRERTELQGELNYLEEASREAESDGQRLQAEAEELKQRLNEAEAAVSQARTLLESSREDMTDKRVSLAAEREKLQALTQGLQDLEQEKEEAAWEAQDKSDLLSSLKEQEAGFATQLEQCQSSLAQLGRTLLELGARLEQDRHGLAAESDRQRELEQQQREHQQTREKLNADVHQLQLRRERWQADFENEAAKLAEKFALDLEQARARVGETAARTVLISRLNQTRKEMAALGQVNPGSIEEYRQVSERYAFLTGQRDDMVRARADLNGVITEMDGIMTGRFRDTFRRLSAAFDGSFRRLFGGGNAALFLSRPDDPLTSGVELRVDLPGKRVSNYNLLSGGEKALIGIALMFATLEVRPTPFCMMDEVDAALDEANIDRFTAYLQDKSSGSQFVMISHRQSTMEAASALWGVTMEEEGVSKLISVRLTEMTS